MEWKSISTTGRPPLARYDHTATIYGNKMYVLGGADLSDSPLSDVYALDLGMAHVDTL
jgi:hypothetical protein